MWDQIAQFWHQYSGNIIITVVVGFLFFVLGPLGLWFSGRKIRRERVRKAKEALVDLLEGMIVNQAKADEPKLRSLYLAVEREVDIDLSGEYSNEEWLGDVVLRFEKSRHLSAAQKQEYYEAVAKISDNIRSEQNHGDKQVLPREHQTILSDLRSSITSADTARASSLLDELEQRLSQRRPSGDPLPNILAVYRRLYQRSPVTFVVVGVLGMAIYFYVIMKIFPFFIRSVGP